MVVVGGGLEALVVIDRSRFYMRVVQTLLQCVAVAIVELLELDELLLDIRDVLKNRAILEGMRCLADAALTCANLWICFELVDAVDKTFMEVSTRGFRRC